MYEYEYSSSAYSYEDETEAEACFDPTMTMNMNKNMNLNMDMNMNMALMLHQPKSSPMSNSMSMAPAGLFHIPTSQTKSRPKPNTVCSNRFRRIQLNAKYDALLHLIPKTTKHDKGSILEGTIDYIKELLTTLDNLKALLHTNTTPRGGSSFITTSWFQRKSRLTEVHVRVANDEVTINLLQRNKVNGLLYASQALQCLHLDPHHVAGGHFGHFNSSSFFFNIKVLDGSCVCAKAIANKLIEVGDTQFAICN